MEEKTRYLIGLAISENFTQKENKWQWRFARRMNKISVWNT